MSWRPLDDWNTTLGVRLATFERLGASVEELAKETIESILGFEGKGGHKPPRPDIQKYKDAYDLHQRSDWSTGELGAHDQGGDMDQARQEYTQKYVLNEREQALIKLYKYVLTNPSSGHRGDAQSAFNYVVNTQVDKDSIDPDDSPAQAYAAAKKELATALKKYEQRFYPTLYTAIKNALDDAYRRGPLESYKIWPRIVTWIKDEFDEFLMTNQRALDGPESGSALSLDNKISHILDVALPAGKVLDQLRRENKLPQGFDVNKVSFKDFEQWYMEWKKENLGSENAGEVVYEFKDGWTIQKLTTPEQLQFEGDEMGHCVGGYAHSVGRGQDIIYSLRDPKGIPHVTIEMKAIDAYKPMFDKPANELNAQEGAQLGARMNEVGAFPVYEAQFGPDTPNPKLKSNGQPYVFTNDYLHPEHDPNDEYYDRSHAGYMVPGKKTFEVVQVMGNSNQTPKPEYQRKIKEFLDYLRKKGWNFIRSNEWFAPFDDPQQDQYGEGAPDTAEELDEWYDNHYKTHHEAYRGVGDGDAYGLPAERATIGIGDWDELFKSAVSSLVDEYDPYKWRGNWKDLAQAVYHAWMIDIYKDHLDPTGLKIHEKNLLDQIQRAEEQIDEWSDQYHFDTMHHNTEAVLDRFEELAQKQGVEEQFEERVNQQLKEEYGSTDFLPYGVNTEVKTEIAQSEFEDLWVDAQDALRDDIANDIYGNAYKFCQYLYMLATHHGAVNPAELPDPNERHGGLPSYDDLKAINERAHQQPSLDLSGGAEQGLPGAFSHQNEAVRLVKSRWPHTHPQQ